MESLDYGRAVAAFERVTAARDAGPDELVHAYGALVRCQVVLGAEASARLAAEQLLELDPGAELQGSNIPPRVTRFFSEFRRGFSRSTETVVVVNLPDQIPSGRGMDVAARITRGRRGVATLRMRLQFGDTPAVTVELTPRERGWVGRVQVPATFDAAFSALRYWVEARAPSGALVGGLGTEDEPMVVAPTGGSGRRADPDVRRDRDPVGDGHRSVRTGVVDNNEEFFRQRYAITSRWWFWTGIVAVVVGGALATAVIVTDQGDPARHGGDGDKILR